jgi:Tfp pilus assembly protein PilO
VTKSNKILIAVVALGLAAAGFYFLVLGPKRDEIAKLDSDIAAKQAEVAQAEQTLATYESARKTYKANYTTLARLGKAVPGDDDVRSLMVQLEASADGTGVDFQSIELGTGLAGADSSTATATGTEEGTTTAGELAPAPGSVEVAGGALSALPFSFKFTGSYFDLNTFFAKLERYVTLNNAKLNATGRLLRLESVSIAPSTVGFPEMQAEIGAATYIVPPVEGIPGIAAPSTAQNAGTTPSTPSAPSTTTANAGAAQ